jgi:hypothetical protein
MPRLAPFRAHAIVQVEAPPVGQTHVACAIGTECLRLELSGNSFTWLRQALDHLHRVHPFWKIKGVTINMRPNFSVSYTRDGEVIEVKDTPAVVPIVWSATVH